MGGFMRIDITETQRKIKKRGKEMLAFYEKSARLGCKDAKDKVIELYTKYAFNER